jgi:LPS export ABC transporter permease LptG
MLKLIDRYLARSFLQPMVYCLLAFIILFVAYDLSDRLDDFMNKQVPTNLIVKYYLYNVPIVVSKTTPFATLLALLYCLGNLSRTNEIIAMRASGIALFRIIQPYLILGVVMYVVTLALSETYVPRARRLAAKIVPVPTTIQSAMAYHQDSETITFYNSNDDRKWHVGAHDASSSIFFNVSVIQYTHSQEQSKTRRLDAREAEFVPGFGWWFYQVTTINYDRDGTPYPARSTAKLPLPYYQETPADILSAQRTHPEMMTLMEMVRIMRHINPDSGTYKKLRMERVRRFAEPAACFVFVLLAAPFGVFHTRAGMVKGVLTSITLCLFYYIVAALFIQLGNDGHIYPLIAAWIPGVTFTAVGAWLLYRMR